MSNAVIISICIGFILFAWLLRRHQDKHAQTNGATNKQTQFQQFGKGFKSKNFKKNDISLAKQLTQWFPKYLIKEHQTDNNTAFICLKEAEQKEIAIIKIDGDLTNNKKIQKMGSVLKITYQTMPTEKIIKQDVSDGV